MLLIHHLFFYYGHYGIDDMWYARLAAKWSYGDVTLHSADHYEYRWTIVGLTAWVYKILGIHDFSSALTPLLQTGVVVFLLGRMHRSQGWVALLAVAFFVSDHWTFYYSDKLMPDTYVACYAFLSIFFLSIYSSQKELSRKRSALVGSAAAFFLFSSFLSKGTFILLLPAYLLVGFHQWRLHKNRAIWTAFVIVNLLLFGMYFFYFHLQGDVLARIHAIGQNSYFNTCSYDQLPISHTLRRVGYLLMDQFLRYGLFAPILVTLFTMMIRKEGRWGIWHLWLIGLLFSANFMSISITAYIPLCPEMRHFLFLVPIAAITGARGLVHYFHSADRFRWVLPVLFVLISAIAFYLNYSTYLTVYLPLAIATAIPLVWDRLSIRFWSLLVTATLLLVPLRICTYARTSDYPHQKKVVYDMIKPLVNQDNSIWYSNHVQRNFLEYYAQFTDRAANTFKDYPEGAILKGGRDTYLFLNGYTRYLSGLDYNDLPEIAKQYYAKEEGDYSVLYEQDEITILKLL